VRGEVSEDRKGRIPFTAFKKGKNWLQTDRSKKPRIFAEWQNPLIILHIQEVNSEWEPSS
jgi:hypothetical protein